MEILHAPNSAALHPRYGTSFDAAQQAEAIALTQMGFDLDTGGGLVLPSR